MNKSRRRREKKALLSVLRDPKKSEVLTRALIERANILQDVPIVLGRQKQASES